MTEHLKFYGRVKGLEASKLKEEIADVLQTMQMSEWAGKLAQDLSGGMKRRLCLAIAFMGRSRYELKHHHSKQTAIGLVQSAFLAIVSEFPSLTSLYSPP